jgi:hypothetical protein
VYFNSLAFVSKSLMLTGRDIRELVFRAPLKPPRPGLESALPRHKDVDDALPR